MTDTQKNNRNETATNCSQLYENIVQLKLSFVAHSCSEEMQNAYNQWKTKPRRGDTLLTVCVTYGDSVLHNIQSPARTTFSEACKVSPHAGLMMYVCFRFRKFHFVSHTVNKVSFLRNFTQLSLKIKLLHEHIISKKGRTILDKNFFRTRMGNALRINSIINNKKITK